MKVQFLHGTETGTAEALCEDLAKALPASFDVSTASMEDIDPQALSSECLNVFVCSTFGSGDLPTSAIDFYDALTVTRPDLSGRNFAMFGLGDQHFADTFAQGSERLMQALQECGAKMTGERGIFDASSSELPEDVALPWLAGILGVDLDAPKPATTGVVSKIGGFFRS